MRMLCGIVKFTRSGLYDSFPPTNLCFILLNRLYIFNSSSISCDYVVYLSIYLSNPTNDNQDATTQSNNFNL